MKPPLVLLHGWGSHPLVWRTLTRAMAAVGSHGGGASVETPALPGYAGTEPCTPYTLEQMADRVAAAAPRQCVVAGWSLGAQLALTWARRHPRQVTRLVLLAATPCFIRRDDWPHGAAPETLRQFGGMLKRDPPAVLRRFVALQSSGDAHQVRVAHKLRSALFTNAAPHQAALEGGLEVLRTTDLREALPSIRQPVLVIHGDCDAVTPCEAGRLLAAQLPAARCEVIAGAAHAPFLSDTARVAQLIGEFRDAAIG